MGDNDDGADVVHQEILQPADGGDVQVVGRLVEQDDVRLAEQRLREQDFDLFLVVQRAHRRLKQRGIQPEPLQQAGGVGFDLPAVELGEFGFQLGGEHPVLIGELLLGVQRFLLLDDLVQARVAEDDGVEHRVVVEGKVILLEHRHTGFGVDRHRAGGRLEIPGQDAQEGRFSRAVCADHAVAVAGGELQIHVGKQILSAEIQADIGYGNHKGPPGSG